MEYAFSKLYEAFWGKLNNKTIRTWLKADNIILFRTGVTEFVNHLLHCVVPGVLRDVTCDFVSFVVSMEGKE
jgi:hypothetical protein